MASRPGLLTEWPWQRLGNFKYVVVAPWVAHSFYLLATKDLKDIHLNYILIFPSLLLRMLHNQIWISISRLQTARSPHRIVDKSIDFEQVDRERNWDDQILFNGILFYVGYQMIPDTAYISAWKLNGVIINILLHAGPVEFLYYWFHRALHHHFLYSRYHSHHHASIVTEPITSVIHPFAEHIVYFLLFAIPLLVTIFTRTASMVQFIGYIFYIDFMNNMGHCNFELVPKWLFSTFPPLKYLMYTPSFHSLHHTQFRTNYSLFMPFYDYLYNTMDKSSDEVYETSWKGKKEIIDVVHLTHPTTLQSIYHLRLGIASLASKPHKSNWYDLMMWPMAWVSMVFTWFYSSSFVVERNKLKNIKIQTWVIPRYKFQYGLSWEKEAINDLIEKTILEADTNGVKVLSLGLLNQAKEINESGELYIQKYPKLKLRIVDGSSLAAAVIINSIPKGTQQVLLKGNISKVGRTVIQGLCNNGVKVVMTNKHDYYMLEPFMLDTMGEKLLLSNTCMPQVWLVGDGLDDAEQWKAEKGTTFIPFSHFPPKKVRKDCLYYSTAAMKIPNELQNIHACENWLPRKVMSAWRIAGIIHALEGWDEHECGDTILQVDKIWMAALRHGFLPLLNE
ncbi:very-long-chain aldehyde decarbonylase GL1-5 [Dendrobium catenatum]|uniref:very-long-chain aldehyde decarbonylase GL1-5 n=1 Tax=Dendrobium catenatum TaxID=906689 RepID=UPI0009F3A08D|nr:very-long-chain aldehyde decarbonylase GL1-5 [Dendrobium catenatum]